MKYFKLFEVTMAVLLAGMLSLPSPAMGDEVAPEGTDEPVAEEPAAETEEPVVEEPLSEDAGFGWSTLGGEILDTNVYAVEGGVGWPGLGARFHFPVLENFEVIPSFTFFWAFAHDVGAEGDTLTAQMKYRVFKNGPISVALQTDLGLGLIYNRDINVFIRLGIPQLAGTYRIDRRWSVHFGFKVYFDVFVKANLWKRPKVSKTTRIIQKDAKGNIVYDAPGAGLVIPILFNAGFEYTVTRYLNLFATLDIGPAVFVGKNVNTKVEVYPNFLMGVSYLF